MTRHAVMDTTEATPVGDAEGRWPLSVTLGLGFAVGAAVAIALYASGTAHWLALLLGWLTLNLSPLLIGVLLVAFGPGSRDTVATGLRGGRRRVGRRLAGGGK